MAVVVSILTPQLARAQNVNGFYSGTAQTLTYIQQQYVFAPLPQATITVCLYPASLPTPNLPCTNLATLYVTIYSLLLTSIVLYRVTHIH